jgi:Ca2+-binding EF-hand superfamily protein
MTRSLLASVLPVVLAGAALTAYAQTKPTEQPVAAKDKAVVESAFSKADANADGKLSKEEAAKLPAIGAKFEDLDKNKDGNLTMEEFAAGFVTAS